jgi:hypothetical protein
MTSTDARETNRPQVTAVLIEVAMADPLDATPTAVPRECYD